MSIHDNKEKNNPVRDRGSLRALAVSNGVKSFILSNIESSRGKSVATVIIVILVGLGSFGLGRVSNDASSGIEITSPSQSANVLSAVAESTDTTDDSSQSSNFLEQISKTPKTTRTTASPKTTKGSSSSVGKIYFASSRGNKYYHIGCSGGKTLKPENKIYFATEAEAISAGYEKSSTCK